MTEGAISVGSQAPDFSLSNQDDELLSLGDLRGNWVVLYAYSRDDTPG